MEQTFASLTAAQTKAILAWNEANNPSGEDFEYADNDRVARVGNAVEEAAYDDARDSGCCGFVDVLLQCEDGTEIRYGFNYGH